MLDKDALKRIRTSLGFSLREFAKELDISYTTLSYLENGKRKPSQAMFNKIVAGLKRYGIVITIEWRGADGSFLLDEKRKAARE